MTQPIALVVVNYASHDLIAHNFPSDLLHDAQATLFVVDNFTSQAEVAQLNHLADERGWRVITNSRNLGFGAGVDRGAQAAIDEGFPSLLLVNPDVQLSAAVIRELSQHVSDNPNDLVSPRIVTGAGTLWFDGGSLDPESGRVATAKGADMSAPYAWLSGACLAVSAQLWQRIGGFDEQYFLYWEDVDISAKARSVGGNLVVRDDLTVMHEVGATQGSGKSVVYLRYNARNRLIFAAKWLPVGVQRKWILRTPMESYRVLVRGGRRNLLEFAKVKAVLTGSIEGVRYVRSRNRSVPGRRATGAGSR